MYPTSSYKPSQALQIAVSTKAAAAKQVRSFYEAIERATGRIAKASNIGGKVACMKQKLQTCRQLLEQPAACSELGRINCRWRGRQGMTLFSPRFLAATRACPRSPFSAIDDLKLATLDKRDKGIPREQERRHSNFSPAP